jgi:hypothetical protein
MRALRIAAAVTVLMLGSGGAAAARNKAGGLPAPARVDCGNSGVVGTGFTVYACDSGAGATKYSHPAQLLVVRTNGSYKGYPDAFSQADLIVNSNTGAVIATHNNSIVRVSASGLTTLANQRQLNRLLPGSARLLAIEDLTADSSDDIVFRANFYAGHRHGCENVRGELKATKRVKLLWRSATGLTCG